MILLCLTPAYGQWQYIGTWGSGANQTKVYLRDPQYDEHGSPTMWVKHVPTNRKAFLERFPGPRNFGWFIERVSINCSQKLIEKKQTVVYSAKGKMLAATSLPPIAVDILPGSLGQLFLNGACSR